MTSSLERILNAPQKASTHAEAFDEVLNMYRHVGLNQPLPSQYEELFCSQPATRIILSSVYYDVISIHKLALSFFRQRRELCYEFRVFMLTKYRLAGSFRNDLGKAQVSNLQIYLKHDVSTGSCHTARYSVEFQHLPEFLRQGGRTNYKRN